MSRAGTRQRSSKTIVPQDVEASGVVMVGACAVHTPVCQARKRGPLTAVWTRPARIQIDVCGACLHEKLASGDWHMDGKRSSAQAR